MTRFVLLCCSSVVALIVGTGCSRTSVDDLEIQLETFKVYRSNGVVQSSSRCTACPLFAGEEIEFLIRWTNTSGDWVTADLPACEDTDPATGSSVLYDTASGVAIDVFCADRDVQSVDVAPVSGFYGDTYESDQHIAHLFVSKTDIVNGVVPLTFGTSLGFRYDGAVRYFNLVDASL